MLYLLSILLLGEQAIFNYQSLTAFVGARQSKRSVTSKEQDVRVFRCPSRKNKARNIGQ